MQCAVCYDTKKPLRLQQVKLSQPKPNEVLVRTAATSICHSDIHLVRGIWPHSLPVIAGHESAGVVEAVGSDVRDIQVGDKVVVCSVRTCGSCYYCVAGASQCCTHDFPDNTDKFVSQDGEDILIGLRMGGFAEAMIVDQSQIAIVPEAMPLDRAALLACGVLTGYGAVVNTAKAEPGKSVGVVGVGGVGINSIQAAYLIGASQVLAIDVSEEKLQAAVDFGASHTIDASRGNVLAQVLDITKGKGLDYSIVTAPVKSAMVQGIEITGFQGKTVIVGIADWTEEIPVRVDQLMREKSVTASRMGSGRVSIDIPHLAQFYLDGRLKLDELITDYYRFSEINAALEASEAAHGFRNVLIFGSSE
jgi:Zn-dependent alcohol dehydrogenase